MFNSKSKFFYLSVFTVTIFLLLLVGLVAIYSSSSIFSLEKFSYESFYLKKQVLAIIYGVIILIIISLIPYHILAKFFVLFFLASLGLTALTLLKNFSISIHGSKRWLVLGGFSFQPSELLKISFILYISLILKNKGDRIMNFLSGFLPIIILTSFVSFILLRQPDFGQAITCASVGFILLFLSDCRLKHLAYSFLCALPVVVILILFKDYRLRRILTFLDPWQDSKGAGFQIIQSLIAIGSGGLTGVGISNSKQKFFYLPMQHTDFIFSIIAEEIGFVGCMIIFFLFLVFTYFGFKLAFSLNNMLGQLFVLGYVALINIQLLINIFVTTGLAPTKGLGLPFISYGNSAVISNLIGLGLIINFTINDEN